MECMVTHRELVFTDREGHTRSIRLTGPSEHREGESDEEMAFLFDMRLASDTKVQCP